MPSPKIPASAPRDAAGVALYRHEAIAAVLQVREGRLCVLLSLRTSAPFEGEWTLPSGPLEPEEPIDAAVLRHLAAKVDVGGLSHLEQLGTQSDPGRDPAQRTIGTSYLGLMPTTSDPVLPQRAAWHQVDGHPALGFDHGTVVANAVDRLRAKLSYTNIGFALVGEEFTIAELREAYVAALGHDVAPTNLQRILTRRGQLVETERQQQSGAKGGRPARVPLR